MFCPKCGTEQTGEPNYCGKCGQRLKLPEPVVNPIAGQDGVLLHRVSRRTMHTEPRKIKPRIGTAVLRPI